MSPPSSPPPPSFFLFFFLNMNVCVYITTNLQFCSIKLLHFAPLNNIIDYLKSNDIVTNFSTTFLQIVKIVNFYWFASRLTTYITFLLSNNHSIR